MATIKLSFEKKEEGRRKKEEGFSNLGEKALVILERRL